MQKKLLMLNASTHEIPFILAARKLGFYVITTSTKKDYPGHKYADEYICGDYNDYGEMEKLARKLKIDAISQACTDDCALSAAYIGEKLGLKGHDTYENAQIIHRKDRFKKFAEKYHVITPISKAFTVVNEALLYADTCKYPVIVKPVDLAGGQGIHIAESTEEYIKYIRIAFDRSKEKRVLVEPYIKGTLHSLNTFIVNGKVASFCTANDYSYENPYMTNSGVAPADNWGEAVKVLIPETERIAGILGLVDGQLHMQYIMSEGQPWIIEMMRRNIGNNWMSMLMDSAGVNWPEWVIRAEAGMNCSAIPMSRSPVGFYGYHMIMGNRNGVFCDVEIEPEFQKYIYQFTLWQGPGFEIKNYLSDKVGNLLFHFSTEEEKNYYMPKINELVHVVYE